MKVIAMALVLTVTACAARQPGTPLYRDATGQKRGDVMLAADERACKYEVAQAQSTSTWRPVYGGNYVNPNLGPAVGNVATALASGPNPKLYDLCMGAKGWDLVGFE